MRTCGRTGWLLAAAVAVAAATVGCDTGEGVSANDRTTPAAVASPRSDAAGCDSGAVVGDIDGNGVDDRAVHVHAERAVVRVCLDDGDVEEIDGLGMAESLELVDVDRDGHVAVYYGATTGHAEGGHLAVWHDGQLRQVTTHDGSPLLLERGGAATFDDDAGRWSEYHAWGCDDLGDDGTRELVTAHTVDTGDGYQTNFTGYTLNGATADEKLQTTRRESAPIDQAQELLPSCEPDGHDV